MKTVIRPDLREAVIEKALALGFDDVGFCSAAPFDEWRGHAYASLFERMTHDPAALMPGAATVVVAVRRYGAYGPWPEGSAEIANYYVNSNIGFGRIRELARFLGDKGCGAVASPRLPAKQAALRAGLGTQGMNTQFCHRSLGMLVSIHLVLTDAGLGGLDEPRAECGHCGRCASACPGGAIYPGGFDHEKCLRFHMASGSTAPLWARDRMGMRLVGCTDCQHACGRAERREEEVPRELAWACDIAGLLRGDGARYERLAGYIGANFAGMKRIRPQAALCAGNSGDPAYAPLLAPLLREEGAALRSHAAWALGRLGGTEARPTLALALDAEPEESVRREIAAALEMTE